MAAAAATMAAKAFGSMIATVSGPMGPPAGQADVAKLVGSRGGGKSTSGRRRAASGHTLSAGS